MSWDGRIVGGWRQDKDGAVELQMLEDVGGDGRSAIECEAARLSTKSSRRRRRRALLEKSREEA